MKDELLEKVVQEVIKQAGSTEAPKVPKTVMEEPASCGLTEFVGTAVGDTIGIVIASVDPALHEMMGLDPKFRSIGVFGGRTGAGPQIMAADEAVKATNTEIVTIELPRDTKGGAGHGSLIVFGAEEVSDARRAVEVALKELKRTFGDVYGNDAGHLEFQYTARASFACNKAFGAPIGKAFGLTVGAPAVIGVIMADTAVKAASVEVLSYSSPAKGTSLTNEVILAMSGDSGAVRQALVAARDVGMELLKVLGGPAASTTEPYI